MAHAPETLRTNSNGMSNMDDHSSRQAPEPSFLVALVSRHETMLRWLNPYPVGAIGRSHPFSIHSTLTAAYLRR